ncbi:phage shock protein E (rhodanase-like protein) [Escherichia coli]|uniref:Phage shock protein E (Rhodanase-like protein) n=1 Tax=Escherichia coli TaxID=562 RepID=A0A376KVP0_ECOLX|nr:phage shock protein E (rhodanase-like protein) [Escherichia coli]
MFKKGLLALALVFSLPVFAAEHWIDVRVPEQYQQEHVQGAINIPLKEVKERIATAVPDKKRHRESVLQCRTPVRASKRDP